MTRSIALITGASRGLGRNMALHLAKRGVHIIGTYRSGAAEAESLKQHIEAQGGKIAMLALDLCVTVRYDPWITLASMLPSLLAYYKPGFHPNQQAVIHNYPAWIAAYERSNDPLMAGEALYQAAF